MYNCQRFCPLAVEALAFPTAFATPRCLPVIKSPAVYLFLKEAPSDEEVKLTIHGEAGCSTDPVLRLMGCFLHSHPLTHPIMLLGK